MSTVLFAITATFHLLIPIGLAAVLAWRPAKSKVSRALGVFALLGITGFLFFAGAGWAMLGQGSRFALVVAVLSLSTVAVYRCRQSPTRPRGVWSWSVAGMAAIAAVVVCLPYPSLANARTITSRQVDLQSPLEHGSYLVIHGGGNAVVNHHALVHAQQHALDIVAVGSWGFRADGLMPTELSRYEVYGKGVLAPCEGIVLSTCNDLDDLPPLESDRSAPAGNHVLLYCSDSNVTLTLAHLQKGSVTVDMGQSVPAGHMVGRVGNSGNTSEPHLHIHAVDGRVDDIDVAIRTASPVAMRFGLRTLVRNDVFEGANPAR